MNADKDSKFKEYVKIAKKSGWVVEKTNNGHWVFIPNNTNFKKVFVSGTPSNKAFIWDMRRDLKRAGLNIQ